MTTTAILIMSVVWIALVIPLIKENFKNIKYDRNGGGKNTK